MPILNDRAIVLRLSEYSETSQIVTLFAAGAGLLRLIAKGTRKSTKKRFAAGLDLLEFGEVGYAPARGDATLSTLTEWVQRDSFGGLRGGLDRLYAGLYFAELVCALTEESDPHPELFDALLGALRVLADESAAPPTARIVVRLQLDLLNAIGYTPNLRQCMECGRARVRGAPAYFSARAGGLICRDCEMHHADRRTLPAGLIDRPLAESDPRAWFEVFNEHLQYTAGKAFQTARQLQTLLGRAPR